jgi:hypothetical protein
MNSVDEVHLQMSHNRHPVDESGGLLVSAAGSLWPIIEKKKELGHS